jgi:hydroxymethylglutaryl-CoA lyase
MDDIFTTGDGLQNEMRMVPAEIKFSLVKKLIEAGCKNIESASFVNPNKIPAMANSKEVCTLLNSWRNEGNLKYDDVVLSALTPNLRGFEDARGIVDEVAIFASASEMFSQKNIGCSIEESFVRFEEVMIAAKEAHIPVRGYVSCILGCPYSNRVAPTSVADVSLRLLEMGCYEISLGDTIGVGTANKTKNLLKVLKQVGGE